jgi:hypothetical protein
VYQAPLTWGFGFYPAVSACLKEARPDLYPFRFLRKIVSNSAAENFGHMPLLKSTDFGRVKSSRNPLICCATGAYDKPQAMRGKRSMQPDQAPDSAEHREWLLNNVFAFDVDFRDEFRKIQQLVKKHAIAEFGDNGDALEKLLRYRLGRIVYGMKCRYRDPEYAKNISELKKLSAVVAVNLDKLAESILRLDDIHTEDFGNAIAAYEKLRLDVFVSKIGEVICFRKYFSKSRACRAKRS